MKKWHNNHSLNEEYSIKFSPQGINDARYIVCIPKTSLDLNNPRQLDDLFSFIPDPRIRTIIQKYLLTHEIGWIGYAVDYSDPKRLKKKVYFDFGKNSGKGIDSYEWQDGGLKFFRRQYHNTSYDPVRDAHLLSGQQQKIISKLNCIDVNKTLVKEQDSKRSLCFAFQSDTYLAEVIPHIWQCVDEFYHDKNAFDTIMGPLKAYKITWIYMQPFEVTIYYRKRDWVY